MRLSEQADSSFDNLKGVVESDDLGCKRCGSRRTLLCRLLDFALFTTVSKRLQRHDYVYDKPRLEGKRLNRA